MFRTAVFVACHRPFGPCMRIQQYARSTTGAITGPWVQSPAPLYAHDDGHPMLFRTFAGQLLMALHTPNRLMLERVRLLPVRETADGLALA